MSDRKPPRHPRSGDSQAPRRPTSRVPDFYDDDLAIEQTETFPITAPKKGRARETLTVLAGLDANRVYPLGARATWIGRGETCNLRLRDRGVSRRHACIAYAGRSLVLRDNRAKNGTYVNGRRIDEHPLRPGDEIQLGPN